MKVNVKSVIYKWCYVILVWFIVLMCLGVVVGFDELFFIVGGFFVFGLEGMWQQYLVIFVKRVEVFMGMIWWVNLNDVLMGEIVDVDYVKLQFGVFNDLCVYVWQFVNFGCVVVYVFDQVIWIVLFVVFWIGFVGYIFFLI